jgi:hypothetical protein
MPSHALKNCFAVKAVDNFDYCPETVHGKNSLHIVTQIIVQSPENHITPSLTSTPIRFRDIDSTPEIMRRPRDRNYNDRAAVQFTAARGQSACGQTTVFDQYKKIEDNTFDIPLFCYLLAKCYAFESE